MFEISRFIGVEHSHQVENFVESSEPKSNGSDLEKENESSGASSPMDSSTFFSDLLDQSNGSETKTKGNFESPVNSSTESEGLESISACLKQSSGGLIDQIGGSGIETKGNSESCFLMNSPTESANSQKSSNGVQQVPGLFEQKNAARKGMKRRIEDLSPIDLMNQKKPMMDSKKAGLEQVPELCEQSVSVGNGLKKSTDYLFQSTLTPPPPPADFDNIYSLLQFPLYAPFSATFTGAPFNPKNGLFSEFLAGQMTVLRGKLKTNGNVQLWSEENQEMIPDDIKQWILNEIRVFQS